MQERALTILTMLPDFHWKLERKKEKDNGKGRKESRKYFLNAKYQ